MTFGSLVGNDRIKKLLRRAVAEGRIGQGLIFAGPRGVGKYRFALALAHSCMPFKTVFRSVALLPLLTPSLLSAMALTQLFGGQGVVSGQPVEVLYRDIRALRIYEGASEVQQLIIARELLKDLRP